jgi:hypothetical protein
VLDAKTKVPVAEVTLAFSGVGDATTDAQGAYRMTVPYGWSGTVQGLESPAVHRPALPRAGQGV